ncbi:MFS transporter [bacterium]|nr:MFS transporter [bacterium]
MTSDRSAAWAIFGVFFFESSVIGQWIPRIPDIKQSLSLSDGQLGLALLSMPLGTLLAFTIAGRVIHMTGLRNACRIFLPLWALLFILPGLAQDLYQLMLALLVSGLTIGMIETAMNTEAARIENAAGKRLMSRCHGFWSLGTMLGALMGGFIAHQGVGVAMHFLLVMPLIAIAGYTVATILPVLPGANPLKTKEEVAPDNPDLASEATLDNPDTTSSEIGEEPAGLFTLPHKAILLLCVMPLGINMVEGAFVDWSAVFMREVMAASPLLIAVTYSFFAIVMAITRLSGDYISERLGELNVVRASGIAATLGIGLFAMAPSPLWAFVGAAISGAGVAIVFPLAMSAAANRPGRSPTENVAALNMIAFSAFLVAPPLIGFLSELIGLRNALLSLAPLAFLTFLLAGEVDQPARHR